MQFKKTLLFAALLAALAAPSAFSQTVFVKSDATGTGDGTSWANAFLTLDAALLGASNSTEIWVAKGLYTPEPNSNIIKSSFSVKGPVAILGGFNGDETDATQRNPTANPTILSGDLGADDVADNFLLNRQNNCQHILTVTQVPAGQNALIDGFTITGGRADTSSVTANLPNARGGAIYAAASAVHVNNCVFTQNGAFQGAAIYASSTNPAQAGIGTRITNTRFFKNKSNETAAIYCNNMKDVSIENCEFTENTSDRGAVYMLRCVTSEVKSCLFESNVNPSGFGGAFFSWSSEINVDGCRFLRNTAGNAGGCYIDGREQPDRLVFFKNCEVRENKAVSASGFGGGLYFFRVNARVEDCDILSNEANASVGGLYFGRCQSEVRRTKIEGNKAGVSAGGWGGGTAVYADQAAWNAGFKAIFDSCEWKLNTSSQSGGGLTAGFLARVEVRNSVFEGNAGASGGGVFIQNDSTSLSFYSTGFSGNTAINGGGGINKTGSSPLTVVGCQFDFQTAATGAGIAVTDNDDNLSKIEVRNTVFYFNAAEEQSGAINVNNCDVDLVNCLFSSNSATDPGVGGCISNNASDSLSSTIRAVNCTFAANVALIGSAISQWENEAVNTGDGARLFLQNCVFEDGLDSYANEPMGGSPEGISLGGNLCLDASMNFFLTQPTDAKGVAAGFLNPANEDFHLAPGSPCINSGVKTGAPTADLEGLPRDAQPDKGCYEFGAVGLFQPMAYEKLVVSPNPLDEQGEARLESDGFGLFSIKIIDGRGQVLFDQKMEKAGRALAFSFDAKSWAPGVHFLLIEKDGRRAVRRFVKI